MVPDVVANVTDNDADLQINEIRVSHTSFDNESNNFLELYETSGTSSVSTEGLSVVVLRESAFFSATPGEIVEVYSLDGGSTDSNGFFLLHDDGFAGTPDAGDVELPNVDLIGGEMTYVVVAGFSGSVGDDLDEADDGTLDSTPWTYVYDSITLDDLDDVNDPIADYSDDLGGTIIEGLDDGFPLAAASAIPDGSNAFVASAADPFNDDSGDTPGSTNQTASPASIAGRHIFYNRSFYDGTTNSRSRWSERRQRDRRQ